MYSSSAGECFSASRRHVPEETALFLDVGAVFWVAFCGLHYLRQFFTNESLEVIPLPNLHSASEFLSVGEHGGHSDPHGSWIQYTSIVGQSIQKYMTLDFRNVTAWSQEDVIKGYDRECMQFSIDLSRNNIIPCCIKEDIRLLVYISGEWRQEAFLLPWRFPER